MAKLYTMEKVLYFASQDKCLHVAMDEPQRSDLSERVGKCIERGHIELAASDDSGSYYRITNTGRVELLKLQIAWRREHGKDTSEHEQQLAALAV